MSDPAVVPEPSPKPKKQKKTTRKSISVRGATYAVLHADCKAMGVSVSDHIEKLIAADKATRSAAG